MDENTPANDKFIIPEYSQAYSFIPEREYFNFFEEELEIPEPPLSPEFESFDELFAFLQSFSRDNGAGLIKKRCGPKRTVNGALIHTNVTLMCDREGFRPSESAGIRRSATRKTGCQFKIIAKTSQQMNGLWTYTVPFGLHNHGPSLGPSAHPVHRRRSAAQSRLQRTLYRHRTLPPREMGDIMRESQSDPSYFTQRDIYNDRQRLRRETLGGLTATQAWIAYLRRKKIRHSVQLDDERKVAAVFWTYPWCEMMWKRFPEVLGMDNTYKTNRFNMYLFQVTGITDQKSVANFGFGLINNEREEGYSWLCEQLNYIRLSLRIPSPEVIITDKEMALKNALSRTFPFSQQQLCIYHINANIRAKIISRWHYPDASKSPEPIDHDDTSERGTQEVDLRARAEAQKEADSFSFQHTLQPPGTEYSADTMYEAWKRVIYAPTEGDFFAEWSRMVTTYKTQQNHVLKYISDEYMPWREQWASCYIRRYRNYGQRVNSPTETAHKDIKSFLLSGHGDLLHLHNALIAMIEKKERDYDQKAADMMMRQRHDFIGRSWLSRLPLQVYYVAIDLINGQYRLVEAAMRADDRNPILRPCEGTFTQQNALPCSHQILRRLQAKVPLTKDLCHPRWWLRKPLDLEEPLLQIQDPNVVTNLRGRPRGPVNGRQDVPKELKAAAIGHQALISHTPTPTMTPTMSPAPLAKPSPRVTRPATRPSARRILSLSEIETQQGPPSPLQAAGPPTRRSTTHTNTRGRGSGRGRGRGGRGGRGGATAARNSLSSSPQTLDCIEAVPP